MEGPAPRAVEALTDVIRRRRDAGVGIVVVEHDQQWVAQVCGRVLRMADGSVVVEGSFAWIAQFRWLAQGYERLPDTFVGLHFVAFACLMLHRLLTIAIQSP